MLYTARFLAISLVCFFTTVNIGAFFLFPVFVADRGGTAADIGYIMGAFFLAAVLSRPLISASINHLGRKQAYAIANLLMIVASLSYLFFSGRLETFYLPLLAVRAIHGVSSGFAFTAGFTYVADIVPENRMNEGIGMFGAAGLLGLALGPAAAELIILRFGFSAYFLASAAAPGIGLLLLFFLPESYVHDRDQGVDSFVGLLGRSKIFIVALLIFILGIGMASSNSFVALFAQSRGISFISSYFIAYSGSAIAVRFLGGKLADVVGEIRVLPYAISLCGLGLILLVFVNSVTFLLLSGLISGAAHGMLYPCLNTIAVRNEPAGLRAKILGIVTGSFDLGLFAGAIVLGQIGEFLGFSALFLTAGLTFFVGLAIIQVHPLKTVGKGVMP